MSLPRELKRRIKQREKEAEAAKKLAALSVKETTGTATKSPVEDEEDQDPTVSSRYNRDVLIWE